MTFLRSSSSCSRSARSTYNKENILSELDCYLNNLRSYRDAIANDDRQALIDLLEEGKRRKEEVDG